jgi:Vitamin K-dependent gamma-carboxylase
MSTLEFPVPQGGLRSRIGEFFYRPEVPYALAIIRILLPIPLFIAMAVRWQFARELFSSDGAPVTLWGAYGATPLLPAPTGEVVVALHSILLLTLITSCIGWCTRFSLMAATSSYIYLSLMDILGTMNKSSVIAAHLLLLLCFSHCGSIWSVDSWLRRSRLRKQGAALAEINEALRYPAWPRRLLQIFIGVVYFGAASTKVHTPEFFSGLQLQVWMITNYTTPNLLGRYFAYYPSILIVFAYVTIFWELLFLFTAWRGVGRILMIGVGTMFHVMTWLTLGLYVFPIVCTIAYIPFLNENDVEWGRRLLARWRERGTGLRARVGRMLRPRELPLLPVLKPAVGYALMAVLVVTTAAGGVGLEYKLDRYGLRRPEGPYRLKELDPNYVAAVTAPTTKVLNEDKVLTFDVGSNLLADALIDRRTQFHAGETILAECGLIPPHDDLWMECEIQDSMGRSMQKAVTYHSAESMRLRFQFDLEQNFVPGPYAVVLKISGKEIIRRPITVAAGRKGALAN